MRTANARQLERLKARLDAIPVAVRNAVKPSLATSGEAIATEMQRLCPVDSGELRATIKAVPGKLETQFTIKAGSPTVPYAAMVEFGTSKMEAQPYFMPAYRALRGTVIGNLKAAVVRAAKEAGK